jgi:hypothetical protein
MLKKIAMSVPHITPRRSARMRRRPGRMIFGLMLVFIACLLTFEVELEFWNAAFSALTAICRGRNLIATVRLSLAYGRTDCVKTF